MEPEARYAWVGIAVLALVALLVGGLYWLTGGTENQEVKRFTLYFERQSLEGLQINSDVRMQGIKVGKVEDYAIMPGEAGRVRVTAQVDARTPVLQGVEATIARNLVTGLAAIDLTNPPEGGPPLMRIPEDEDFPVIPEGVPQLARVASTLEEMGQIGRDTLVRFNTLLSDRNQKAMAGILNNLNGLSADLRGTIPEINATLASTRQAEGHVEVLAQQASKAISESNAHFARIADQTGGVLNKAGTALTQADATLKTIDNQVGSLATQLKMSADLSAQEIQITAQSLRLAGDALQESGRALAEPAVLLYGINPGALGPGED